MRPEERDAALLWDMLRHAREASGFIGGKTWVENARDTLLRRAVERSVQIVGEAANEISHTFRTTHPEAPWRPIIAKRHILVDEYGEVEDDKVWRIATVHIPALIEPLIPSAPHDPEPDTTP